MASLGDGSKWIAAWSGAHGAELRLAVRVTVAGVGAFALAHVLGLAQGYWAVFTAVIVMQASIGGSLKATLDRLIGTLGGAIYGGAVATVVPHNDPVAIAVTLAIALLPLAFIAAVDARFRVAPVTAVIVLLSPFGQQASPIEFTIDRILEIALGSVVALVVSVLVLPARAHSLLTETTGKLLNQLAAFVELLFDGLTRPADKPAILRLQVATRRAITTLDAIAVEAQRERTSHLTDDPDPDPVARTATRVRNDLIMIARAATTPLPPPFDARLAATLAGLRAAIGSFLRQLGEAFANRRGPPGFEQFDASLCEYHAEIAALRQEGVVRTLPAEAIGRLFTLSFALDQLRQNVGDLADRASEFARRADASLALEADD